MDPTPCKRKREVFESGMDTDDLTLTRITFVSPITGKLECITTHIFNYYNVRDLLRRVRQALVKETNLPAIYFWLLPISASLPLTSRLDRLPPKITLGSITDTAVTVASWVEQARVIIDPGLYLTLQQICKILTESVGGDHFHQDLLRAVNSKVFCYIDPLDGTQIANVSRETMLDLTGYSNRLRHAKSLLRSGLPTAYFVLTPLRDTLGLHPPGGSI
jgi:hypothetical protein